MEYREGMVVDHAFPPSVEVTERLMKSMTDAAVDTLVRLHQIDYKSACLESLGRPQGFLARQVQGWTERYMRSKTHDIPEVEPLTAWLASQLPGDSEATLIHNDFKLNNMIFATNDLSQVVAVVDWEMATIGDPLLDLAVTMSYWVEDGDPAALKQMLPTVTKLPGFPTRSEFIAQYAAKSGRDVSNIQYYLVFAYFKLAVILQQIYYRYKHGQTKDERFATFHVGVRSLIAHAYTLSVKA
jgi:aminoglycoside phosphotransferase (APT) family kinase protein